MDIVKAIIEQIKIIKTMREELKDIETLDFKSTCETMDRLLESRNQTPLSHSIYRQWGIVGGESMDEIYKILDEWLDHVNSRCKDEV